MTISQLYEQVRIDVDALVTVDNGDTPVPACPEWTVGDVARHLCGLAQNWLDADLEVYASAEWTQRQVAALAEVSEPEVLERWRSTSDRFGELLDDIESAEHLPDSILTVVGSFPPSSFPSGVVVDAATHLSDIKVALGHPPHVSPTLAAFCVEAMSTNLRLLWRIAQLPTTCIRATDLAVACTLGKGETVVELSAPGHDLFRSLAGRRTIEQIGQLGWTGPPELVAQVAPSIVVPFFAPPDDAAE